MSQPTLVTFAKVNTDQQKDIASAYSVTSLPTFILFREGKIFEKVQGADPRKLQAVLKKLGSEVESANDSSTGAGESSGSGAWRGADLPRNYVDITDQVEAPRLELLNIDTTSNSARVLFDESKPSALGGGKKDKDWVESDTDEQLMLFMPFMSMIKLHSLQVSSLSALAQSTGLRRREPSH